MRRPQVAAVLLLFALVPAGAEAAPVVDAGALRAEVGAGGLRFTDARGGAVLEEALGGGPGSAAGALGFQRGGLWFHATRTVSVRERDGAIEATLATDDPAGSELTVRVSRRAEGVVRVEGSGPPDATRMGVGFRAQAGERFLGFGERSDAVVRTGGDVEHRVTEGPYQPIENPLLTAFVPPPGYNTRADASYFPLPWLLSSRGYGVLLDEDEPSEHSLDGAWSMEVAGARLRYRVYAGPKPADALARFSADVGRQPPAAAPFYFGPWWQPQGKTGDRAGIETLRKAGALGSVMQTYTHYLPCADQLPDPAAETERTARAHAAGLAITTYFNPMICTSYEPRYQEAVAKNLLTKTADGRPYEYRYTGSAQFFVGQLDFTAPGATSFFGDLLDEAVTAGYDGWMEDFGEYTPLDSRSFDGTSPTAMHNRYVTDYHRAARTYARERAPRPLARFNRSGWIGSARESQIVWGGDPSTSWGFDGLASSVKNGLSMGLSGVSLWGSDVGGFFALSQRQTTPELMRRWLQAGFAQGVMRTQANGFSLTPGGDRAQIFDADVLPTWTRYARLRTQLYPYLDAAERAYDASGLPIMRQLALAYPDDPKAVERDDTYLFGPDLLVAPVVEPGATEKRLYLPKGRWVDLWRSVSVREDGSLRLKAPVVLEGGREVTLPAPQDQLPMLVREGAVIPMLPADVTTLSPYGKEGVVHLSDRDRRRTLLAWPKRGGSSEGFATPRSRVRSGLGTGERWTLRVSQEKRRRFDVQVAMPRKPCALVHRGKRQRFDYADGVLTASVRMGSGKLVARTRC